MKRTESTFGLSAEEWEETKAEIVAALEGRARNRQMISGSSRESVGSFG